MTSDTFLHHFEKGGAVDVNVVHSGSQWFAVRGAAQVKHVHAGSATNLAEGMKRGVDALNASAAIAATAGEPAPDVKRVFLFSDGLVNAGEQSHERILAAVDQYVAQGVTLSTFGIGADFDEQLMTSIAVRGKGDYEFLEKTETMTSLVSKSVHSLLLLAGCRKSQMITSRGLAFLMVPKNLDSRCENSTVRCTCWVKTTSRIQYKKV